MSNVVEITVSGPDAIIDVTTPGPIAVVEVHDLPRGPEGPPGDTQATIDAVLDYLEENPPSDEALEEHIVDTTPHPAYDDLPSLTLLFENGLV